MPFSLMFLSVTAIFLIIVCVILCWHILDIRNDIMTLYRFYIFDGIETDYSLGKCFKVILNSRTSNTAHNEGNNPSNVEKGQEDERRDD